MARREKADSPRDSTTFFGHLLFYSIYPPMFYSSCYIFFFFLHREFVKESLVVKRRGEILGISEYTRLKESCLLKIIDMNI